MWLLLPILLYSIIFLYIRHVYSYWERKGFPTERTALTWHFLKQVYQREFQHVSAINEAYATGRERLLGIYFFFRPTLLVRDAALARVILESSNGHFDDTKWHFIQGYRKINLLEKLAPIFSVSRLEGMFRNVEKVADHMLKHVETTMLEANHLELDLQNMLRTYTINVFANLVYGLDSNVFEQKDCVFANYIPTTGVHSAFNSYTLNHLPKKSTLTYRLRDIIKDSVECRENGGLIRKDIFQLLVKFRNGNNLCDSKKLNWHVENVFEREKVLSVKKMSKIAERFLNMGFETVASAIVLTFFEVLQSPNILKKILAEIHEMEQSKKKAAANAENTDNRLTYVDIDSLEYLSACIQETLRKYPGMPFIERVCRKNFNVPDSRVVINEGKTIMIPVMAIQRDEKYFDEPDTYKPERFLNAQKGKQDGCFIGYGLGAGVCVAQNFATLIIKMAIVKLLLHFDVETCIQEVLQIIHNPTPLINSKDGFKVKLTKHSTNPQFYL